MKEILFKDICDCDFNVHHILAKRQKWKDGETYSYIDSARQKNGLMYLKNCSCTITTPDGKSTTAKAGEMLYMPKGSHYRVEFAGKVGAYCLTHLVSFLIDDADGEEANFGSEIALVPKEIADDVSQYIDEIVLGYGMIDNCSAGMKALMYNVCYNLGRRYRCNLYRTRSVKYSVIADGIEYIENNIATDVSIDKAAQMCAVSAGCFRRLFREYAGCSPKEYVVQKKLCKAKELLRSGIYDVSEVADLLGFVSPAYFSRFFKKKFGCTPSQYMAEGNVQKQI